MNRTEIRTHLHTNNTIHHVLDRLHWKKTALLLDPLPLYFACYATFSSLTRAVNKATMLAGAEFRYQCMLEAYRFVTCNSRSA